MRKFVQTIASSDPWLAALVIGTIAIAVFCSFYAGGQTEFPEDKTTITMCRGGVKRDRIETRQIVSDFEQRHPDIHCNVIFSNVARKPDTMLAAGIGPDLLAVPCDNVSYYTEAGVLVDLVPYIDQDPNLRAAFGNILFEDGGEPDFIRSMVEPFLEIDEDGTKRLYAIPINYTPFIIYFNKDLFDRYNVPYPTENWDWDDLLEKATALTRDEEGRRADHPDFDETRVVTYGFLHGTWQHVVESFIRQNNGRLINEAGDEVIADNPETVEALQFLYDLKHKYNVVPTGQGANANNISFAKGTIGMNMWGVFRIPDLNLVNMDWDVAPLPRGRTGKRAAVVFPNGWGITTQSENPDAAYEFLSYLCSPPGMKIADSPVFLPTRRSVLRYRALNDPLPRPASRWALTHDVDNDYAHAPYSTNEYYGEVYAVVNEALEKLLFVPNPPFEAKRATEIMTERGNFVLERDRAVRQSTAFGYVALALAIVPLLLLGYKLINRPRKGLPRLMLVEERWGYALISPWLIGFTVFSAFPILVSIVLSFSQWTSLSDFTKAEFIGVENYYVALSGGDPKFWTSLWVTFRYALIAVPAGLVAGLALAILMNQPVKGITIFRTLYYIPAVLPSVAAAILWWHLFDRHTGWINRFLSYVNPYSPLQIVGIGLGLIVLIVAARLLKPAERRAGLLGSGYFVVAALIAFAFTGAWFWAFNPGHGWIQAAVESLKDSDAAQPMAAKWLAGGWMQTLVTDVLGGSQYPVAWLNDARFTPWIFIVMSLWVVGGGMIIYLAGLQGIPTQLYEAAEIDGATRWQRLRNVTIPMLSPVIFFNLIMGVIGSFQVFNIAFVLFDGATGPNDSALFYGLHLFREAFMKYRLGYASALAWILFVIILAFTALIFKSSPMWVYYESAKERKS